VSRNEIRTGIVWPYSYASQPLTDEQYRPQTTHFQGFSEAMLSNARWQLSEHQYAAAILLAQWACEAGVRSAFTSLIAEQLITPVDSVLNLVPGFSFRDKRARQLWTALTDHDVTDPDEIWKPYRGHLDRRNRVAHGSLWGDANDGRDARGSVAAVEGFIAQLDSVMRRFDS
jgi:hypothetical protein